ncbi:hypothetical protein HK096_010148, partial [Nowakowskiella sp. JEL0078]
MDIGLNETPLSLSSPFHPTSSAYLQTTQAQLPINTVCLQPISTSSISIPDIVSFPESESRAFSQPFNAHQSINAHFAPVNLPFQLGTQPQPQQFASNGSNLVPSPLVPSPLITENRSNNGFELQHIHGATDELSSPNTPADAEHSPEIVGKKSIEKLTARKRKADVDLKRSERSTRFDREKERERDIDRDVDDEEEEDEDQD